MDLCSWVPVTRSILKPQEPFRGFRQCVGGVCCNSIIWVPMPISFNQFLSCIGVVPMAPISNGITLTFMFHFFLNFCTKSWPACGFTSFIWLLFHISYIFPNESLFQTNHVVFYTSFGLTCFIHLTRDLHSSAFPYILH